MTTNCGAQNLAAGVSVVDQGESDTGVATEGVFEATAVPIVWITFVFRLRAFNVTVTPVGAKPLSEILFVDSALVRLGGFQMHAVSKQQEVTGLLSS
jgi:hypothetical protein